MFFRNVGMQKHKRRPALVPAPKLGQNTQTISATGPADGDHLVLVKTRQDGSAVGTSTVPSVPEDGNRSRRFGNPAFFSEA